MLLHLNLLGYIDPASGAIVLQAVLAGVFAAGLYFRRLLAVPFGMFFRSKPR